MRVCLGCMGSGVFSLMVCPTCKGTGSRAPQQQAKARNSDYVVVDEDGTLRSCRDCFINLEVCERCASEGKSLGPIVMHVRSRRRSQEEIDFDHANLLRKRDELTQAVESKGGTVGFFEENNTHCVIRVPAGTNLDFVLHILGSGWQEHGTN